MNICEALKEAKNRDCGIRQSSWEDGVYTYHGMDNQLFISGRIFPDMPLSMAVATLLADDWELALDKPYHGERRVFSTNER